MYGLPADFDAAIFVACTLEQICFSENQVALHFGLDLSVVAETSFVHENPAEQPSSQMVEIPSMSSGLMTLLGARVSRASASRDGTLIILFENEQRLRLEDTSPMHESYRIKHRGREIIV